MALNEKFNGNKVVPSMIRLHLAMFYTGKLLAPGVKQGLKFYLNSPNFFPWGTNIAAKKQITVTNDDISVSLYLSRPMLNPTLYNSLAKYRVKGKWITYLGTTSESRTFTFPGNTTR